MNLLFPISALLRSSILPDFGNEIAGIEFENVLIINLKIIRYKLGVVEQFCT